MPGGAGVLAGVLVRRAVATQRRATLLARAQMHPMRPDFYALRALAAGGLFDGRDGRKMDATSVGHTSHRFQILMNELDRH